jgi:tetratricopeptide (TPR) repeat protein
MNKQQIVLVAGSLAVLLGLYFLGPTVAPDKRSSAPAPVPSGGSTGFSIDSFKTMIYTQLNPTRKNYVETLDKQSKENEGKEANHNILHQLSGFWKDSADVPPLHYFYEAKLAELDNTEKSLTFAAHSILRYLPFEQNQPVQQWLAGTGKQLFDRAFSINATNDSTIVGIGGCIMYGAPTGESGNPMEGIMKVREVAERDSTFLFAQYMLGVGGMISKQYDRAASRFEKVAKAQPENLEIQFKLAEAFELAEMPAKAIVCYQNIYDKVANEELRMELMKRITALKAK